MKLFILFIFVATLLNVEGSKKNLSLGESSEKFTVDLFKNLIENNTENQLISPISIQTILGLLQLSSKGACLKELAEVLHLPKKQSNLKDVFKNYLQLINDTKIDLSIANNVYVAKNFQLPKQIEAFSKLFGGGVEKIDPLHPQEAVKQINQWVENQTNHKIKDIVDEEIINENTVMVLVNALYFNAHWKYPFDDELTHKAKFYANENQQMKTEMMIQEGNFNYRKSDTLNAKILELPYEDEDYVMNIVLPNEKDGLTALVKKINKVFREFDLQKEEEKVTVVMPKFKFEYKIELNDVLKKMGITSIFNQLELKGQNNENLKVSKIMQKTYIDVNEKGSEGAAATAIGIEDRIGGSDDKIFFVADHPFIFLIRHKKSDVVLFMGTYKNPETDIQIERKI